MADSVSTKKITDLTEKVSLSDTDILLVGNEGNATLRKVKWSTLVAAVTKAIIGANVYTYTNNGVSITVYESAAAIRIKASGTTTGKISTSAGYVTYGTVKRKEIKQAVKKIVPSRGWTATLRVNVEDNKIQLGYTAKNGEWADIQSGIAINIDETILFV